MCTNSLGDGLCCGYDCYEETPMAPVNVDPDAWVKYVDEGMYSMTSVQEGADIGEEVLDA